MHDLHYFLLLSRRLMDAHHEVRDTAALRDMTPELSPHIVVKVDILDLILS